MEYSVDSSFRSVLWICHFTVLWCPWFLIRNWQLILSRMFRMWWVASFLLLSRCSLSLIFHSLILMCLSVDLFVFNLFGACWVFWLCRFLSPIKFDNVFSQYFFKYYFCTALFLLSSGGFVGGIVPQVPEALSIYPQSFYRFHNL